MCGEAGSELTDARNALADRTALADRKVIEQAKGILMKQKGLEESAAYGALRRMAMDRNLKLVELARSLIVAAEMLV